jgi:hypothetical protein
MKRKQSRNQGLRQSKAISRLVDDLVDEVLAFTADYEPYLVGIRPVEEFKQRVFDVLATW